MKKKKIIKYLVLLILVLCVFGIYYFFKNEKLNYVALGDALAEGMNPYGEVGYSYTDYFADLLKEKNKLSYYTKQYTKSGYTTTDIMKEIEINSDLKRELRESDVVTISIGAKDFLNSIDIKTLNVNNILELKNKVTEILPNLENCIKNLRKYAKEDIIIIGYYNPIPFLFNTSGNDIDELFAYIDDEYQKIADKYDCDYISIYQLFKNNSSFLPNPADIHPNLNGYEAIAEELFDFYYEKEIY